MNLPSSHAEFICLFKCNLSSFAQNDPMEVTNNDWSVVKAHSLCNFTNQLTNMLVFFLILAIENTNIFKLE